MPTVTVSDACNGDGVCVDICPTNVFDLVDNKAVPERADDCILCMACVPACPTQAITVEQITTRSLSFLMSANSDISKRARK